jgi:hypothetical protein
VAAIRFAPGGGHRSRVFVLESGHPLAFRHHFLHIPRAALSWETGTAR